MDIGYTAPPKLKLIFDHLRAIRTINEYVDGEGMKKDMQELFNHVAKESQRTKTRWMGVA
jgi:hypothetical protein